MTHLRQHTIVEKQKEMQNAKTEECSEHCQQSSERFSIFFFFLESPLTSIGCGRSVERCKRPCCSRFTSPIDSRGLSRTRRCTCALKDIDSFMHCLLLFCELKDCAERALEGEDSLEPCCWTRGWLRTGSLFAFTRVEFDGASGGGCNGASVDPGTMCCPLRPRGLCTDSWHRGFRSVVIFRGVFASLRAVPGTFGSSCCGLLPEGADRGASPCAVSVGNTSFGGTTLLSSISSISTHVTYSAEAELTTK